MPPETPPFRGSWTSSRSNPTLPLAPSSVQAQGRPKKKAAKPLILQPPKVKDVDIKQSAPKKQLFRAEPEKEPEDPIEKENEEKAVESKVDEEDSGEIIINEESSDNFTSKEESSDHFFNNEESSDHFFNNEESSNHFFNNEESSDHFFNNEESSEQVFIEGESSEQNLVNEEEQLNRKSYEYPLLGLNNDDFDEKENPDQCGTNLNPADSLERLRREYGHQVHDIKVKLPVNLAHVNLEVDIFDTFHLSRPIGSVTNVEWSIHSIDMDVILPTANFFSKGILLLDLEYVEYAGENEPGTMHSLKLHVPWSKILTVEWILQPELSCNQSKEYMFTENDGSDPTFHREFSERLVDKLDFQLTSLNCIWNEQLIEQGKILIQGSANMQIDIFQKQCVDLSDLVCLQ